MKQKLILSLFLFLLLAGVIAIYNRTRSSFETFQDNSEANRYLIKYFDKERKIRPQEDSTNVIYTNVAQYPTEKIADKLNAFDIKPPFYDFANLQASININVSESSKSTLSFLFILDKEIDESENESPSNDGRTDDTSRKVLVSSNYWYIELRNDFLTLVFNGKPIKSYVRIDKGQLYNVVFVFNEDENYIKFYVNGNMTILNTRDKGISLNEYRTQTIKLGLDKDNKYNFKGLLGGITYADNKEYTRDDICNYFRNCKLETTSCKYIPRGSSVTDCVKNCFGLCRPEMCMRKCLECNSNPPCEWLTATKSEELKSDSLDGLDANPPEAPKIRALPDNGTVLIDFAKPEENNAKILDYTIYIQEAFNKSAGVRINIMMGSNKNENEYLITNLKNGIYYNIGIKARNSIGTSDVSNVEVVSPNGPISRREISDSLLKSDNELLKDDDKIAIDSSICTLGLSPNKEGHALGMSRKSFVNEIRDLFQ